MVLQDLLELTHTLTRLRSVPGLKDDPSLTEGERTRGAALAETLSIPVLGRAWQMLLKGLGEVNEAPDRRAAAEMVLIRLAHVAELPTPGDLVKRLLEAGPAPAGRAGPAPAGGGGGRRPARHRQWRRRPGRCGRRRGPGPAAAAGATWSRSPPAAAPCCTRIWSTASIRCNSPPAGSRCGCSPAPRATWRPSSPPCWRSRPASAGPSP